MSLTHHQLISIVNRLLFHVVCSVPKERYVRAVVVVVPAAMWIQAALFNVLA